MAARTGQRFLAKAPERFRGRVQVGPEDAAYAAVSDGARFVLVPASRQVRALAGQEAVLARDARGRFSIRGPDRERGR